MSKNAARTCARTVTAGLVALVLTACGSSEESTGSGDGLGEGRSTAPNLPQDGEGVFDFTQGTMSVKDSLTIRLPEKLKTALGSGASDVLVESFTLTPHQLDGVEFCAAGVAVAYANDGENKLAQSQLASGLEGTGKADNAQAIRDRAGDLKELGDKVRANSTTDKDAVDELRQLLSDDGNDYIASAAFDMNMNGESAETTDALVDKVINKAVADFEAYAGEEQAKAGEVSREENIMARIAGTDAKPGNLDTADPDPGLYSTGDPSKYVLVQKCGANAFDDVNNVELRFPQIEQDGGDIDDLARAEVTVMKDGTMGVRDSKVSGMQQDVNGDWIAD